MKSICLACIDSWPRVCVVLPFLETCSQDSSNSDPCAESAQQGDWTCSDFKLLGLAVIVQSLSVLLYISCLPVSHSKTPQQDIPDCVWQESSSDNGCRASLLTLARQLLKHGNVLCPTPVACMFRGSHQQSNLQTAHPATC